LTTLVDTADRLKRAPRLVGVGAVALYRAAISPVIHAMNGPACRFEPSCSAYARDAIVEYGMIRGGVMALWRIARCNPLGGHGYDPVAPRAEGSLKFGRSPAPATRSLPDSERLFGE
jgi:uncharacterized protein